MNDSIARSQAANDVCFIWNCQLPISFPNSLILISISFILYLPCAPPRALAWAACANSCRDKTGEDREPGFDEAVRPWWQARVPSVRFFCRLVDAASPSDPSTPPPPAAVGDAAAKSGDPFPRVNSTGFFLCQMGQLSSPILPANPQKYLTSPPRLASTGGPDEAARPHSALPAAPPQAARSSFAGFLSLAQPPVEPKRQHSSNPNPQSPKRQT